MFIENRRKVRPSDASELAKVEITLARSRRLIAEIDVLLKHSHELIDRQALLHRA